MADFTFHQLFIIQIFKQCRTVPKTIEELNRLRPDKYKSPSYVRKVVHLYRTASDGGDGIVIEEQI